jgi:hypothetical protein
MKKYGVYNTDKDVLVTPISEGTSWFNNKEEAMKFLDQLEEQHEYTDHLKPVSLQIEEINEEPDHGTAMAVMYDIAKENYEEGEPLPSQEWLIEQYLDIEHGELKATQYDKYSADAQDALGMVREEVEAE